VGPGVGAAVVAALAVVVGCTSDSDEDEHLVEPAGDEPVDVGPLSPATEEWWAYDRPAEHESVLNSVDVEMRDGTPLDCSLVRPASDGDSLPGPFPGLVVEFTPYQALRESSEAVAAYFAERGYNALVCNVRGTGDSGGTWQHAMSAQDAEDAHDLVEWLAEQPFSDSNIGQVGHSYGGFTSYGAAVEQAPHLRAIAALQAPGSLYHDVIYPGGIKATEDGTIDNWPDLAFGLSGGSIDPDAEYEINRQHSTFDDYWQERSFHDRHDAIEVPVLAVGSWDDMYFRSGAIANIEGASDRTWAIYGLWPHLPPVRYPGCDVCLDDGLDPGIVLAWFDHWVIGLDDAPIPDDPTFVSYEGPDATGAGWRQVSRWDPTGVDPLTLDLSGDATLRAAPGEGGPVTFSQPGDPEEPDAAATFTSEPLSEDRVLLGRPILDLEATLSAPDANLYVELLDVAPDGTTTTVNDGFLRASHRDSHTDPEPLEPDRPTRLVVEIRASHHRFATGHSIGLRISGGAEDTLVPNETPVDVSVDTANGASTLTLPGIAEL
jgi:uncharacterized protein